MSALTPVLVMTLTVSCRLTTLTLMKVSVSITISASDRRTVAVIALTVSLCSGACVRCPITLCSDLVSRLCSLALSVATLQRKRLRLVVSR